MDFDSLRRQLAAVNKAFYDLIFKDAWLKEVFAGIKQDHIEAQQTDFMLGAYGGPKVYSGRSPFDAHTHIFVTEEMWQLREQYLREAFAETKFPPDLQERWIKIDEAFKHKIVKKSPAECKGRFKLDPIIDVPNPNPKKQSA